MAFCAVYMLAILAGVVVFYKRQSVIEKRYKKETTIDVDDDDNWILGQFYYNTNDKVNINSMIEIYRGRNIEKSR